MASILVNEAFISIQGESSWAGWPCAFIRLSGCSLRCSWCDTTYAYEEGHPSEIEEVVEKVMRWGVSLVEVTGGEPLEQAAAPALLRALCDQELTVLLETNGAASIVPVDDRVHIIMDIKCPSSDMSKHMHWPNLERLKPRDEVKFVVADRRDYEYAGRVIREQSLADKCLVLISPVHGRIQPAQLVQWILSDRLPVRFQLQMHKYIWPPDKRGV